MDSSTVLVTGSRSIRDLETIRDELLDAPFDPDTIVHGDGSRVDELGGVWAVVEDADVEEHPVPEWAWEEVGRKAGPLRNSYMVEQSDAVVAIYDGESSGTKDTMKKAESAGLPLYKVVVDVDEDGQVEEIVRRQFYDGEQASLGDFDGW